jgi:hypothetical protein
MDSKHDSTSAEPVLVVAGRGENILSLSHCMACRRFLVQLGAIWQSIHWNRPYRLYSLPPADFAAAVAPGNIKHSMPMWLLIALRQGTKAVLSCITAGAVVQLDTCLLMHVS